MSAPTFVPDPNVVVVHIAAGPYGRFIIDAKIPGWVEPEDSMPTTALEHACYIREDDLYRVRFRLDLLESVPQEQLPSNGMLSALIEIDETGPEPSFKLLAVRPTASAGSTWDSHAIRDLKEHQQRAT